MGETTGINWCDSRGLRRRPELQAEGVDHPVAFFAKGDAVRQIESKRGNARPRLDMVRMEVPPFVVAAAHAHKAVARLHVERPLLCARAAPFGLTLGVAPVDEGMTGGASQRAGSGCLRNRGAAFRRKLRPFQSARLSLAGSAHRLLCFLAMHFALEGRRLPTPVHADLDTAALETGAVATVWPCSVIPEIGARLPFFASGARPLTNFDPARIFFDRQSGAFRRRLQGAFNCLSHAAILAPCATV